MVVQAYSVSDRGLKRKRVDGVEQKERVKAFDVLFIRGVVGLIREIEAQCRVVFAPIRRKIVRRLHEESIRLHR